MLKRNFFIGLTLGGMLAFLLAVPSLAGTGTVLKYSQPLGHLIDPQNDQWHGENIPSDVDWGRLINTPPTGPHQDPNWVIADDFKDDFDTPVLTVRWWGSYFPGTQLGELDQTGGVGAVRPFMPGDEDGYVISFFTDRPDPDGDRNDPTAWSQPEQLLGSYLINFTDLRVVEQTPYQGWDDHPIFLYEADLMDAHLEHPIAGGPARPEGFFQQPDTVYWISIMAEVGHVIERVPDPTGGQNDQWIEQPTFKTVLPNPNPDPNVPWDYSEEAHFWGWHTSPVEFNDLATMGHLGMPNQQEWQYGNWNPIDPHHGLHDMAFELLTIPEPSGWVLLTLSLVGCLSNRRRKKF